jgi:hypothetical protein
MAVGAAFSPGATGLAERRSAPDLGGTSPAPLPPQGLARHAPPGLCTRWVSKMNIQNGIDTGLRNQVDPKLRYRRNGRDLAAFTHVDVLYQAYLTAFLVLASSGTPLNPGNPYNGSRTENGFGTFGGPDFAGTLTAVATVEIRTTDPQRADRDHFGHLRPYAASSATGCRAPIPAVRGSG